MSPAGRISKRELAQKKTDVGNKKAETAKNKTAKKQALEALRKEVQTNPEKQNEVEAISDEINDIEKQEQAMEAEIARLNNMTQMDIDDDALQHPTSEGENISSAAQVPNAINHAEQGPSHNNLSQEGDDDNKMDEENNSDSETNNGSDNGKLENTAYPTPSPSDQEEIPVMTVSEYKNRTGSPLTACEVLAWKRDARTRGEVVIVRYGPKSHPMFRIERASESFDQKKLDEITKPGYRIGERKVDREWAYNYQNVDGIVAVAYRPKDDQDPLRIINPALHTKKQRYPETQVLIQWKNIKGESGNPRTWETRTTARRVCPVRRKKGDADRMIFTRAEQCEERHAIWLKDQSKGRDVTMTPAPPDQFSVKAEEESEVGEGSEVEERSEAEEESEVEEGSALKEAETTRERRSKSVEFVEPPSASGQAKKSSRSKKPSQAKQSSLNPPNSTSVTKSKQKNARPEAAGSVSETSPPVEPEVDATEATSAPPNKEEWLADYESLFGAKETMSVKERAMMVNAWRQAQAEAAASA